MMINGLINLIWLHGDLTLIFIHSFMSVSIGEGEGEGGGWLAIHFHLILCMECTVGDLDSVQCAVLLTSLSPYLSIVWYSHGPTIPCDIRQAVTRAP